MKEIVCPKCNYTTSDAEIKFCPKCGANLHALTAEWTCKKCGQVNPADTNFCKSCGDSRDKQSKFKFIYSANFKYAAAIAAVILIGGIGSYSYFNGANEDRYLTNYSAVARDLNDVNGIVESYVKIDKLKSMKPEDFIAQLKPQRDALEAQIKTFSDMKPFKNYEKQHADSLALLQKESAIIEQVIQIVSNPLDSNVDNSLESLRHNIADAKTLAEQIKVPSASLVSNANLSNVPEQLNLFVTEQRKINQAKMEKLAANQEFFRLMDDMIHRYDGAKADLGKILDSNKSSAILWADYFSVLDRAKSERIVIRNKVNEITAPPDTENLKREFRAVLDASISYCELMREAANLGFNNYHFERTQKENAAKNVDSQVQQDYESFLNNYRSAKNRLTNINNL